MKKRRRGDKREKWKREEEHTVKEMRGNEVRNKGERRGEKQEKRNEGCMMNYYRISGGWGKGRSEKVRNRENKGMKIR